MAQHRSYVKSCACRPRNDFGLPTVNVWKPDALQPIRARQYERTVLYLRR